MDLKKLLSMIMAKAALEKASQQGAPPAGPQGPQGPQSDNYLQQQVAQYMKGQQNPQGPMTPPIVPGPAGGAPPIAKPPLPTGLQGPGQPPPGALMQLLQMLKGGGQ